MSYRVEYGECPAASQDAGHTGMSFQVMTAAFLLVFVLAVRSFWPQGREVLQHWLLPGDLGPTQTAMAELVTELADGATFGESFDAFCREVFAIHADPPE